MNFEFGSVRFGSNVNFFLHIFNFKTKKVSDLKSLTFSLGDKYILI